MRTHRHFILVCLASFYSAWGMSAADEIEIDLNALERRSKNISCFADGALVHWPLMSYPAACMMSASKKESVVVRWDLAVEGGSPLNVEIVESSNVCFNETVIVGIKKRKYPPTSKCQKGAQFRGLTDVFVFERTD